MSQKTSIIHGEDLGEIIIDDNRVIEHLIKTTSLTKKELTKQYIKDFRKGFCSYWFSNGGHHLKKVKIYCDNNFTNNFAKKDTNSGKSTKANCLDAKDYKGCMEFNEKKSSNSYASKKPEKCDQFGQYWICFNANRGKDMLGTPKIVGWTYIETPALNSTMYVDINSYKLNNRGEYGRFIHLRSIRRIFRAAEAGRLPTSMTIGTARASCYGGDYSINCTITPAQTFTTPGKAPKPARIKQDYWDYVVDCENMTFTRHLNQGRPEKWRQFSELPWWFSKKSVRQDCSKVYSLSESKFYKYHKKGIYKKRTNSSGSSNSYQINCNSPVWKNKPRCN